MSSATMLHSNPDRFERADARASILFSGGVFLTRVELHDGQMDIALLIT